MIQSIESGGWAISIKKSSMDNSNEREQLEESLNAPLLPEMVFTHSLVEFKHIESDIKVQFSAKSALEKWMQNAANTADYISVGCSKDWENGRRKHIDELEKKKFDWTFTTKYMGDIINLSDDSCITRTEEEIDLEMLRRPDPILLFGEVILFEDELADNGEAMLSVKLRVMPECFFGLQRFFLRVDDVLFKVIDTRLFHQFGRNYLLREYQERYATYEELNDVLPSDKSQFTNQNLMASLLPLKEKYVEKITVKKN